MRGDSAHCRALRVFIGSSKGRVHVPPCPAGLGDSLDVRRFVGEGPDALPEGPHPRPDCLSSGWGWSGSGSPSSRWWRPSGCCGSPAPQDLLFAQTSYACVHTFDAETGRLLWTAHLGERSGFARGVASNSWAVFVTNANMLFVPRPRGRATDLATQPRHDPDQHAGLRRVARHGRVDATGMIVRLSA